MSHNTPAVTAAASFPALESRNPEGCGVTEVSRSEVEVRMSNQEKFRRRADERQTSSMTFIQIYLKHSIKSECLEALKFKNMSGFVMFLRWSSLVFGNVIFCTEFSIFDFYFCILVQFSQ